MQVNNTASKKAICRQFSQTVLEGRWGGGGGGEGVALIGDMINRPKIMSAPTDLEPINKPFGGGGLSLISRPTFSVTL